jgi:hypothetical protein
MKFSCEAFAFYTENEENFQEGRVEKWPMRGSIQ